MKKILLEITDELAVAIDEARGSTPRNPWIESRLRRLAEVKRGAESAGVTLGDRPKLGGFREGAGRKPAQ